MAWLVVLIDMGKAASKARQSIPLKRGRNMGEKRKKPSPNCLPLYASLNIYQLGYIFGLIMADFRQVK